MPAIGKLNSVCNNVEVLIFVIMQDNLLQSAETKDLPLEHTFPVPPMLCGSDMPSLVSAIYPDFLSSHTFPDPYFLECAILCPRNSEIDEINSHLIK